MPRHILVIDDDPAIRRSLEFALAGPGYRVSLAGTAAEGLAQFASGEPSVVVLDLFLPDKHGLEVLKEIKARDASSAVIVVTASDKLRDAVEAMKLGAVEYLLKPYDIEALKVLIEHAIRERRDHLELGAQRKSLTERYAFEVMPGASPAMAEVLGFAAKFAANATMTVLIEGETGVGKEFLARAIHAASPRADGSFVAISCAALPETLLESELFGHEAGAFTDARTRKAGLFELAEGGTLFLDEVGEMSMVVQPKLLRAIETKAFRRVGGTEDLTVDTRIIAATNAGLERAVAEKRFREDLFYRLNVGRLRIPPLRERAEDIPVLARALLGELCRDLNRAVPDISAGAQAALLAYRWPGNIRELRNVLERAVILQETAGVLEAFHLPPGIQPGVPGAAAGESALEDMERVHIARVVAENPRNLTKVAKALGISRTTLYEKMRKYGIEHGKR